MVIFADGWQSFFENQQFVSFDDFFSYSKGRLINKNERRDVRKIVLEQAAGRLVFFLKRFHRPHFKDIIFASRNSGGRCSQAAYERQNANLLLANGIDTYQPVCIGEQFTLGIESKSFLVTEQIKAAEFKDFIADRWNGLDGETKRQIIISLGKFIRKIHNAGFSLPDLYVWHLFIKQQQRGQWSFAVIDLHRMARNVTSRQQRAKNLGRLDYSMIDKYFDKSSRELLIKSYAADNRPDERAALIEQVRKYSSAVSSKRRPKIY